MENQLELEVDLSLLKTVGESGHEETQLQLAAQLGLVLLERNKKLEDLLYEYKERVLEQEEELRELTNHTRSLREADEDRVCMYEQVESNLEELQKENMQLKIRNRWERTQVDTLKSTIEDISRKNDVMDEGPTISNSSKSSNERNISMTSMADKKADELKTIDATIKEVVTEEAPIEKVRNDDSLMIRMQFEIQNLTSKLQEQQYQIFSYQSKMDDLQVQFQDVLRRKTELEDEINCSRDLVVFRSDQCCCSESKSLFEELEEDDSVSFSDVFTSSPQRDSAQQFLKALHHHIIEIPSGASSEEDADSGCNSTCSADEETVSIDLLRSGDECNHYHGDIDRKQLFLDKSLVAETTVSSSTGDSLLFPASESEFSSAAVASSSGGCDAVVEQRLDQDEDQRCDVKQLTPQWVPLVRQALEDCYYIKPKVSKKSRRSNGKDRTILIGFRIDENLRKLF